VTTHAAGAGAHAKVAKALTLPAAVTGEVVGGQKRRVAAVMREHVQQAWIWLARMMNELEEHFSAALVYPSPRARDGVSTPLSCYMGEMVPGREASRVLDPFYAHSLTRARTAPIAVLVDAFFVMFEKIPDTFAGLVASIPRSGLLAGTVAGAAPAPAAAVSLAPTASAGSGAGAGSGASGASAASGGAGGAGSLSLTKARMMRMEFFQRTESLAFDGAGSAGGAAGVGASGSGAGSGAGPSGAPATPSSGTPSALLYVPETIPLARNPMLLAQHVEKSGAGRFEGGSGVVLSQGAAYTLSQWSLSMCCLGATLIDSSKTEGTALVRLLPFSFKSKLLQRSLSRLSSTRSAISLNHVDRRAAFESSVNQFEQFPPPGRLDARFLDEPVRDVVCMIVFDLACV
jgi:hypothetical protein